MRWFYLLLALTLTACAGSQVVDSSQQDGTARVSCDKLAASPIYVSYGMTVPQGWTCSEISNDPKEPNPVYYTWTNGNKLIRLFMLQRHDANYEEAKTRMLGADVAEPLKSIRYYTELYLGDATVLENANLTGAAQLMAQPPRGLFFSKNNAYVVIYSNSGEIQLGNEPKQLRQSASVYQMNGKEKPLIVSCRGCSVDEFFSLVINPVIQQ
jgi:hypothetical protein